MVKKLSFNNLSIGWKYGISLMAVFILFAIATGIVTVLQNHIQSDIESLDQSGDRAIKVTEMGSLTRAKSIRILNYIQLGDQRFIDEYEERQKKFDALEAELRGRMDTESQKDLFNQIVEQDAKLNDIFFEKIIPAVNAGDTVLLNSISAQAGDIRAAMVELLDELRSDVLDARAATVQSAKESTNIANTSLLISMVAALIIGIIIIVFISRYISRNLNKVVEVSTSIANGDLSVKEIKYDGEDEIGRLAVSMNSMSENLRQMIYNISEISQIVSSQSEELTQSANEVTAGSQQIATTMQELASGSENQANTASNLAVSMEMFATKVQVANKNGEQIHQSSSQVLDRTDEGSKVMEMSIKQMTLIDQVVQGAVQKVQGLDGKSQEISKLVSVIKDIADQTNLLALNAAIEAARAGEHGRGFTVVAEEVRKLAEQVSLSVTDITDIVRDIQKESSIVTESLQGGYEEVEQGTRQIKMTGETFTEIKHEVNEMVKSIQIISDSLSTMNTGTEEINKSIEEIAAISEESAAGVEQTAASIQQTSSSMQEISSSSEHLAKLAEDLNKLVRRFTL